MGFEPDAAPNPEQKPLLEESTPTKPVQSVAPQVREAPSSSAWESGSDNLLELWDGGTEPPASKASDPADLMDDVSQDQAPPSSAASAAKPRSLLSFDEMMDGTLCSGPEDEPASLVDLTAPDQMTLSYQHALQHAAGEELDDGQLLMTNGETLLKEGTQVRFWTSKAPSSQVCHPFLCVHRRARDILANRRRKSSANRKSPRPNLHQSFITSHQVGRFRLFSVRFLQNCARLCFGEFCSQRPPGGARVALNARLLLSSEIDITCWDTDPVVDDEDD